MRSVIAFLIALFVSSFILASISLAAQYNPEIYQAQKALQKRGYNPGTLDGLWGKSTQRAIKWFQRDVGLPVTGELDAVTKSRLRIDSSPRGLKIGGRPKKRRLALVIGNGAYENAPLKNPVNDANDMASILKELGFDVILKTNANKRAMLNAIDQFGKRLMDAGDGLFFFAGHGIQIDGINYLIPTGAYVTNETDVEIEGVDVRRILGRMETAANDVNIILLDACRDNPFKRSFRSSSRGLARIDAPKGTFIIYATAPGHVAADGEDRNSPFTKHLLRNIIEPDIPIEKVMKKVRKGVLNETKDRQIPWQTSSLIGDFYFAMKNFGVPGSSYKKPDTYGLPPKEKSNFDDILKSSQKKKKEEVAWTHWQAARDDEYKTVLMIDTDRHTTAKQKIDAWQRFLLVIGRNNPYSNKDDDMRSHAHSRISYWQKKSTNRPDMQEKPNLEHPNPAHIIDFVLPKKRTGTITEKELRE